MCREATSEGVELLCAPPEDRAPAAYAAESGEAAALMRRRWFISEVVGVL